MSHAIKTVPARLHLANLPTPIERMRISDVLEKSIYIKRDDFTGSEVSGNKIRKLEYAIAEALALGAKTLITCGGIQSNHCRATAAAARKLGLDVHLVLRSEEKPSFEGNYLLAEMLGAKITLLEPEIFNLSHQHIMNDLKAHYDAQGMPAYIMPIGASNAIGTFGYAHAFEEILSQERTLGVHFDTIVCTVGSGGTYAGLFLGNLMSGSSRKIIGINISATAESFKAPIADMINEALFRLELPPQADADDILIIDGYAGRGYALSKPEEIEFIRKMAQAEGVIFDPVYTGKAFRGLVLEIEKGHFEKSQNILFIHTGGLMGFVPSYLNV